MPDEPALREKAREAIATAGCPGHDLIVGSARPGAESPARCVATPWGGIEMQVEIEFNRHGATPGLDRYHLHFGCFTAWEFERTKAEPAP